MLTFRVPYSVMACLALAVTHLACPLAFAQSPRPAGEVRAMWVVRDTLTSPQKIKNAVRTAKKFHFNTLFVQVRGRGDAFYNSQWEPRSESLASQPLDFDPLAVAVAEGHKAGLEVHAWMNTFLVWSYSRRPSSPLHVVNMHPDWLVKDRNGKIPRTDNGTVEGAFLDPALPGVREHVRKVFLDVALRYDVDGIHFDYVRYPSSDYSFSAFDLSAFRTWLLPQITPSDAAYADAKLASGSKFAWYYCFPQHWKTWRQELVTATVKSIADESHRLRPNLIVSAAVFPSYPTAHNDKAQSWHDWLRDGLLDAVCPMTYNKSTEMVAAQVRDAVANSSGKPIIAGIGAWQIPAASAIEKAKAYRTLGAGGITFFSYDGMTREGRTEGYLEPLRRALFPSPAPLPDWHKSTDATTKENPSHARTFPTGG